MMHTTTNSETRPAFLAGFPETDITSTSGTREP
jgi:hypothetical protein